nr:hypothetical protein [Rhodococcus sp. MTM3W5.2]
MQNTGGLDPPGRSGSNTSNAASSAMFSSPSRADTILAASASVVDVVNSHITGT